MANNNKKNNKDLISFLLTCSLAVILLVVGVQAASVTDIDPGNNSAVNYTFASAGSNTSTYFSLPDTANVTLATMNITGFTVHNWSNEDIATFGRSGYGSVIIQASDGKLQVVHNEVLYDDLQLATYNNGAWTNDDIDTSVPICTPDIMESADGKLHVSYMDSTYKLTHAISNAWNPEVVDNDTYTGKFSSILQTSADNRTHIMYLQYKANAGFPPTYNYTLRHAEYNGTNWTIENVSTREDLVEAPSFSESAFIEDNNGELHFFYVNETSNKLIHINGSFGSWSREEIGDATNEPSIIQDSNNMFHIAYTNKSNKHLLHANGTTGDWDIELVRAADSGARVSLIEDSDGILHIIHDDGNNNGMDHVYGTTGSWTLDTNVAPWSRMPSMIQSADGVFHVTYFDGDEDLAHAWMSDAYPTSAYVDVSNDGDNEYSRATELNATFAISDFSSELQDFIDSCGNDLCNTTLNITSGSIGIVQLSEVNIAYNNKPTINSNLTVPSSPQVGNSTYITANVTDTDGDDIDWVNFTVTAPNGTVLVNNVNGTALGDIWNSSAFVISESGNNWTVNITASDNTSLTTSVEWTFDVNLGTLTPSPATMNYTQEAGLTNSTNFTLSHNGTSYNTIDLGTEGDLANTSRFTVTFGEDPLNVSVGVNKSVIINVTSNETLADGAYSGNITLNRTNDGTVYRIPYTVTLSTLRGVISLDHATKSTTMFAGDTESWQLEVSNTGDRNLENCNLTAAGDISGFTSFGSSDFTVTNATPVDVAITYTSPSEGTHSGNISIVCTSSAQGDEDDDIVNPVTVNANAQNQQGGGGGGGGGGDTVTKKSCDIQVPSKVIMSTATPVEKIVVKNNEDFSITPQFELKDINGKKSATDAVSLDVLKSIITSGESGELLLKLDTTKLDGNQTSYTRVVLSTAECKDVYTDVEVIFGTRQTIISYLDNAKERINTLLPFLNEVAVTIGGQDILWYQILIVISVFLFGGIWALSKSWSYSLGGMVLIVAILSGVIKYVV